VTRTPQVVSRKKSWRLIGKLFPTCRRPAHCSKPIKNKNKVSDVCLRLTCSQSTSTYCALEVSHFMRYTNLRLTYLLIIIADFLSHVSQPGPGLILHKTSFRPKKSETGCRPDFKQIVSKIKVMEFGHYETSDTDF